MAHGIQVVEFLQEHVDPILSKYADLVNIKDLDEVKV